MAMDVLALPPAGLTVALQPMPDTLPPQKRLKTAHALKFSFSKEKDVEDIIEAARRGDGALRASLGKRPVGPTLLPGVDASDHRV
jgi:hypothetical protein